MAGRVPAIATAWHNLLDKVRSGSDRLKQASSIHHRATVIGVKRKSQVKCRSWRVPVQGER
jgi:hypothetical protein